MTTEEWLGTVEGDPVFDNPEIKGKAIHVPSVTEMVHFLPQAKISEQEIKAHRSALRRGLPSPLSSRQQGELERRRQVYLRIRDSMTPEYVQSMGKFLNWMDDAGDAMTTAYWGGKGSIWAAKKVGIKAAGKATPVLNLALVAKDIFDVVNLFKLARLARGKAKGERWRDTGINPFGKKAKVSRITRMKKGRPSLGDYLEILQTTDMLFGVGISFGPAVGFGLDLAFGKMFGLPIARPWQEYKTVIEEIIDGGAAGAFLNGF